MSDREHDVVCFGATGFTGGLVAEHLAQHAPPGARWALAGRNRAKLEAVRARLGVDVDLLHADVEDPASLRAVAESTASVITTVGPYITYGEPVVAACAAAGTAYVDLTGEPEFVDRMYVAHHRRAAETGARLVHSCGFDSIPHDLGVQFTVEQLPEDVPIAIEGFVRASGGASGGTVASAMLIMARARQARQAAAARRRLAPDPGGRRVRAVLGRPRHDGEEQAWLLPMPTVDPQIVRASALALPRYGPDFSYAPYLALKRLPQAAGLAGGVGALAAVSHLPAARRLVSSRLPAGEGPSPEQRAKSWFKLRFRGEGGGERVVCEVTGGDPGYGDTSKMLAESALCLALDDVPAVAGQVTSAQAMGPALRRRLQRHGIGFEVAADG